MFVLIHTEDDGYDGQTHMAVAVSESKETLEDLQKEILEIRPKAQKEGRERMDALRKSFGAMNSPESREEFTKKLNELTAELAEKYNYYGCHVGLYGEYFEIEEIPVIPVTTKKGDKNDEE